MRHRCTTKTAVSLRRDAPEVIFVNFLSFLTKRVERELFSCRIWSSRMVASSSYDDGSQWLPDSSYSGSTLLHSTKEALTRLVVLGMVLRIF